MITVIVKRSAGNDSVGSMWHETFDFDESATLGFILEHIKSKLPNDREDIIIPAVRNKIESQGYPMKTNSPEARCLCKNGVRGKHCFDYHPAEARVDWEKSCGVCGGKMALIRGMYPNTDKRSVCPTCLCERMEQIQEVASNDYGKTYGRP